MGKRKTCKKICKESYFKEHVRGLTKEQNYPNRATRKLIQKDCIKKMCNPTCKKTLLEGKGYSFHPDYSTEEIEHLKSIGALSWCGMPNRRFNIKALKKPSKSKSKTNSSTRKKRRKTVFTSSTKL
jgi:hypothetical protein